MLVHPIRNACSFMLVFLLLQINVSTNGDHPPGNARRQHQTTTAPHTVTPKPDASFIPSLPDRWCTHSVPTMYSVLPAIRCCYNSDTTYRPYKLSYTDKVTLGAPWPYAIMQVELYHVCLTTRVPCIYLSVSGLGVQQGIAHACRLFYSLAHMPNDDVILSPCAPTADSHNVYPPLSMSRSNIPCICCPKHSNLIICFVYFSQHYPLIPEACGRYSHMYYGEPDGGTSGWVCSIGTRLTPAASRTHSNRPSYVSYADVSPYRFIKWSLPVTLDSSKPPIQPYSELSVTIVTSHEVIDVKRKLTYYGSPLLYHWYQAPTSTMRSNETRNTRRLSRALRQRLYHGHHLVLCVIMRYVPSRQVNRVSVISGVFSHISCIADPCPLLLLWHCTCELVWHYALFIHTSCVNCCALGLCEPTFSMIKKSDTLSVCTPSLTPGSLGPCRLWCVSGYGCVHVNYSAVHAHTPATITLATSPDRLLVFRFMYCKLITSVLYFRQWYKIRCSGDCSEGTSIWDGAHGSKTFPLTSTTHNNWPTTCAYLYLSCVNIRIRPVSWDPAEPASPSPAELSVYNDGHGGRRKCNMFLCCDELYGNACNMRDLRSTYSYGLYHYHTMKSFSYTHTDSFYIGTTGAASGLRAWARTLFPHILVHVYIKCNDRHSLVSYIGVKCIFDTIGCLTVPCCRLLLDMFSFECMWAFNYYFQRIDPQSTSERHICVYMIINNCMSVISCLVVILFTSESGVCSRYNQIPYALISYFVCFRICQPFMSTVHNLHADGEMASMDDLDPGPSVWVYANSPVSVGCFCRTPNLQSYVVTGTSAYQVSSDPTIRSIPVPWVRIQIAFTPAPQMRLIRCAMMYVNCCAWWAPVRSRFMDDYQYIPPTYVSSGDYRHPLYLYWTRRPTSSNVLATPQTVPAMLLCWPFVRRDLCAGTDNEITGYILSALSPAALCGHCFIDRSPDIPHRSLVYGPALGYLSQFVLDICLLFTSDCAWNQAPLFQFVRGT